MGDEGGRRGSARVRLPRGAVVRPAAALVCGKGQARFPGAGAGAGLPGSPLPRGRCAGPALRSRARPAPSSAPRREPGAAAALRHAGECRAGGARAGAAHRGHRPALDSAWARLGRASRQAGGRERPVWGRGRRWGRRALPVPGAAGGVPQPAGLGRTGRPGVRDPALGPLLPHPAAPFPHTSPQSTQGVCEIKIRKIIITLENPMGNELLPNSRVNCASEGFNGQGGQRSF